MCFCFLLAHSVLSRLPLCPKQSRVVSLGDELTLVVTAIIATSDSPPLLLIATNLHACVDPPYVARWHRHMQLLSDFLTRIPVDQPVVLCGDLNTTAFRPEFAALLRTHALIDAHQHTGRGLSLSWGLTASLAWCPLARLDHVLVRKCAVRALRNLDSAAGSDHWPLSLDLEWS